jgi:hypothetical protein
VSRFFFSYFLCLTRHKSIEGYVGELRVKLAPYRARQKVITIVNGYRANIFGNLRRIHLWHLRRVANVSDELFTKYLKGPHHYNYTLPHTLGATEVMSVVRPSCGEAA